MSDQTDNWDRSVYTQDYVVTICSYLILLAMLIIVVIFLRNLSIHRKQNAQNDDNEQASISPQIAKDIKAITTASVTAIVIYLLCSISMAIVLTKWIIIDQEHGNRSHRVLMMIPTGLWVFNLLVFLFFILLRRLHIVSPRKWKYTPAASYGVPAVALLLAFSLMTVNNYFFFTVITRVATLSFAFIVVFTYVAFSIIYFRTVSKVMKYRLIANVGVMNLEMTETGDTTGKVTPITETENEADDVIVNIETVNDTVRYALLVMVCVCTTFLQPVAVVIGIITSRDMAHKNTLYPLALMIDTVFNTVSLCLMFRFMDDYYFSVCGSCHRCVLSCCIKKVSNNYRKENPNLTYDNDQYKALIVKQ